MAHSPTLPAARATMTLSAPTLIGAFKAERDALTSSLKNTLSPAQTVSTLRSALDRTGAAFARSTDDPDLQKLGLWLIEVIKSGAGVLDRATRAEVAYVETGAPSAGLAGVLAKPSLFYGAAGLLGLVGAVQTSGLAVLSAVVLAGLHTLEPSRLKRLRGLLPFRRAPAALEDHSGRQFTAEARLTMDAAGLIGQIEDALKTADAVLERLAAPTVEAHWADTPRLAALLQNLLEAGGADDGEFAMELIGRELPGLLASGGVEVVTYSKATREYFDELPGLGAGPKVEQAAPALLRADGSVLRRGTVWMRA